MEGQGGPNSGSQGGQPQPEKNGTQGLQPPQDGQDPNADP